MKDYWLLERPKREPEEERLKRHFAEITRWEQRYAPFEFHITSWGSKGVLAIIRESKRPAPESWQLHGISHQYLAFGVPFGDPRDAIACLSIMTHHGSLPSPLFVKDFHPELLARLEEYSPDELLQLAQLARQHYDEGTYTFPPSLTAGRQPIPWRIPQHILPGGGPVQVAMMSAEPASMDRYNAIRDLMRQLGPRSVLVDLRNAPDTHKELQRRQRLKRNTFTWPFGQAAQCLHPIGLRDTFGMKYRRLPHIVHFAQTPVMYNTYPDTALALKVQVWMHNPSCCSSIVDLLMQQHPLLLVDDQPVYEVSLRRAVAIHLLSLFSMQVEILPEHVM